MAALDEARAHLAKAREFLDAARMSLDHGLFNAATANAVTSGINSKDAIALKLSGRTNKTDRHEDAVSELAHSGPAGKALGPTLSRLLKEKTKSQYQAASMTAPDAARAIEWATRLYEGAQRAITS